MWDADLEIIEIVEAGPPGPPGIGVAGAVISPIGFAFGDVTPLPIHTLAEASMVLGVTLSFTAAFNNGAGFSVGTNATPALLMASGDSNPAQAVDFSVEPFEALPMGTVIYLTRTGTPTSGAGYVILDLVKL